MTRLPLPFYSPDVNCAMCVLSEAILVLLARAAQKPALGLGGCPVAVTVYPPGRGCLHSAPLAKKSRLSRVFLRALATSARATARPVETLPSPGNVATHTLIWLCFGPRKANFSGGCSLVKGRLYESPSPSKEKAQALGGRIHAAWSTHATAEGRQQWQLAKGEGVLP